MNLASIHSYFFQSFDCPEKRDRVATRSKRVAQRLAILGTLLLLVTVHVSAIAQPTVVNGDFNTPVLSNGGWEYLPTNADWNFVSYGLTPGPGIASTGSPWDSPTPDPVGNQYGFLQGSSSISEAVSGFVPGQNYELTWLQSYRAQTASGNTMTVVLDDGLPTQQVISPLQEVTDSNWAQETSDVFTATKDSYTLTFLTTNAIGNDQTDRSALINDVNFQATSQAVQPQENITVQMQIAPQSMIQAQMEFNGQPVGSALNLQLSGSIPMNIEYAEGHGIVGFQVMGENISIPSESGTLNLGELGSINFGLQNPSINLATPGGVEAPLQPVDSNGNELIANTALQFSGGELNYQGNGSLSNVSGSILLSQMFNSALLSGNGGVSPDNFTLVPTGPNSYLVTFDVPINSFSSFGYNNVLLEELTGNLVCTAEITIVPEPSSLIILASALLPTICFFVRRKTSPMA